MRLIGHTEALQCFERAIAIKPDYAEAHNQLGNTLQALTRYDEAIQRFEIALAIKPDFAGAHYNLGNALLGLGRLIDAVACYRKALSLKPDYAEAHSNMLFCLNYHPDLSAAEIFAEYRHWNDRHARPLMGTVAHTNNRDPERRLKIGYVSPDLRRHSTRHFIEPLLAHHDKAHVEVYAYAEVAKEDEISARFKGHVDHWRRTVGLSDADMAGLIRADGIDILVDLAGHTGGNRLKVFVLKPAPIQVSWLGYGYTTGLETMDYFLADYEFAPPGCESVFAEKVVRLPVFAAYRPAEDMGEAGPLPALQAKRITFGTLSRSMRINHRVIRAWAEILKRVPESRLALNSGDFQCAGLLTGIQDKFAAKGIAAERLELGYGSPPWNCTEKNRHQPGLLSA